MSKQATQTWTHWDLNPGPSTCEADVIPFTMCPVICDVRLATSVDEIQRRQHIYGKIDHGRPQPSPLLLTPSPAATTQCAVCLRTPTPLPPSSLRALIQACLALTTVQVGADALTAQPHRPSSDGLVEARLQTLTDPFTHHSNAYLQASFHVWRAGGERGVVVMGWHRGFSLRCNP